jgi:hypothetical protein
MSVSYGGDKITFEDGSTVGSGWAGFKNRIINGAMAIDQRNAGANVTYTNTNSYNLDRYLTDMGPGGSLGIQQVTDAPVGFVYSLKGTILTTTAGSSSQAAYVARHIIEGLNVADLAWGTANAQTVTLSFWVKSSVAGTFAVGVANSAFNRGYAGTYTINSPNTWEYKTITIPGDTTGTWLTNNGIGVRLYWDIGSGSNYTGNANAWQAKGLIGATGTTSIINTSNATFQITGLQFERGTTASSFEYRPYGTELALCQRYCIAFDNRSGGSYYFFGITRHTSTSSAVVMQNFPVRMRAKPNSVTFPATVNGTWFVDPGTTNFTGVSADQFSDLMGGFNLTGGSGLTTGQSGRVLSNNTAQAYAIWDAEL